MKATPLKRVLNKREVGALLKEFARQSSYPVTLGIADATGEWMAAHPCVPSARALIQRARDTREVVADEHARAIPIIIEEVLYGVLYSSPPAPSICGALCPVLKLLIQKELAQKALAKETLDRYREINLFYRVHETIGTSLDLDQVNQLVLEESTRIIKADGGSVLLSNALTDQLKAYASIGLDVSRAEQSLISQAFSSKVFQTGKPRILNNIQHYVRPGNPDDVQLVSLLCAPLKSGGGVLGVITLGRAHSGAMFTAGDEKLLTALASQASIAIANAREVQARERRLRQRIEDLRIQIDEVKKQKEVFAVTNTEYFARLEENARQMRSEFDG